MRPSPPPPVDPDLAGLFASRGRIDADRYLQTRDGHDLEGAISNMRTAVSVAKETQSFILGRALGNLAALSLEQFKSTEKDARLDELQALHFEKDASSGLVTLIHATYDKPQEGIKFKKPKAYIHWISDCPSLNSPIKATVSNYNPLFTCDNPDTHPDGFLSVINPHSEEIFPNAMIDIGQQEIISRALWPKTNSESTAIQGLQISPD